MQTGRNFLIAASGKFTRITDSWKHFVSFCQPACKGRAHLFCRRDAASNDRFRKFPTRCKYDVLAEVLKLITSVNCRRKSWQRGDRNPLDYSKHEKFWMFSVFYEALRLRAELQSVFAAFQTSVMNELRGSRAEACENVWDSAAPILSLSKQTSALLAANDCLLLAAIHAAGEAYLNASQPGPHSNSSSGYFYKAFDEMRY